MLTKHPSAYKHQIAFTFPGTRRSLYQIARNAFLEDSGVKNWTAKLGISLKDDTVFFDEDWGKRPGPEFYEGYRDAVLIVVLFDESYEKSRGAYPEWQSIQRDLPQFHGRVLPIKLDGHAGWKIEGSPLEGYHFNGSIDVQGCSSDDERLALILPSIVKIWEQIISPWIFPPKNTILCFGGHRPVIADSSVTFVDLPSLDQQHINSAIGIIEHGAPFNPIPLRSTCIYAPPKCGQDWHVFERVIGLLSQTDKFRRRSSVRIPVFVPDEILNSHQRKLEDLIYMKNSGENEAIKAWEREYRPSSGFGDWLAKINRLSLINIIVGSGISNEEALTLVQRCETKLNEELIVNVWRWEGDCICRKQSAFDIDMSGLYHAAKEAESNILIGSNLIHDSPQLENDLLLWKAKLNDHEDAASALQNKIFQVLYNKPFSFRRFDSKKTHRKRSP